MLQHWSDQYIGIPYVPQLGDCATLAANVALDVLNIEVDLPDHATTHRAMDAQIRAHKAGFADPIATPMDANPVLLIARSKLSHIGVMAFMAGEWWVLHADEGFGSVIRQPLRVMTKQGWTVEGFYQWKA